MGRGVPVRYMLPDCAAANCPDWWNRSTDPGRDASLKPTSPAPGGRLSTRSRLNTPGGLVVKPVRPHSKSKLVLPGPATRAVE